MEGVVKRDLIDIRDSIDDDRAFILSTWLKGLRHGHSFYEKIDKQPFFSNYHRMLEAVLDDFETVIKVAHLRDSPDVILGFAAYKNQCLHWLHVKKAWRKIGLARDLVPTDFTAVSNVSTVGLAILRRKYPNVRFNPFLITQ